MYSSLAKLRSSKGFALLEVMVALVVVSLALPALMMRMESIARTTTFIEEKAVANWLVQNKWQEIQADHILQGNGTRIRKDTDTIEYDGREWWFELVIEELPLDKMFKPAKLFKVELSVGIEGNKERTFASLVGTLRE